jgi:GT2 family glycosyltransferase
VTTDSSNSTPKGLTVVIVSYGSLEMIVRGHRALLEDARFKVVIVENDPRPIHVDFSGMPDVELIHPGKNLGYGRAANLVLRQTESSHVLLLNPDVEAAPDDDMALWQAARELEPPAAIVAPASLKKDHVPGASPVGVGWVSGCAMLLDVALLREVGLFDENMFLYSEDTELCQRVAMEGKGITLCPAIYLAHDPGNSRPKSEAMERLCWWHFGWSNCYRMTKHGTTSWWKNPWAKEKRWRLRSILTLSSDTRLKNRGKADGAAAFLRGEGAFDASDRPREWQ